MLSSSDRPIAFWLALLLMSVYLLTFSGRIVSSDGLEMFAVTDSFVKRGDFSTDQMWTFFGTKTIATPDGEVYSKYGYGTSLLAALLYALALSLNLGGLTQVTLLACALAVAVTGSLLYLTARRLRFSVGVAIALTLLFGLATPAWVYAKEFWSESFALPTLLAAFYFLVIYRTSHRVYDAVFAGIFLGLAIAVRTTNVLLMPLYVGYGLIEWGENAGRQVDTDTRKQGNKGTREQGNRETGKEGAGIGSRLGVEWIVLIGFGVPVILFIGSVLLYNQVRFENPLTTGYRPDETFSNPILLGIYGLLFSPGKGLFVYAPFLAALPFGVWQFYKRMRREFFFLGLSFLVYLILFSAWYYWWGGTNWAARFLVPTLPFLVLLCAPLVELLLTPPKTNAQLSLTILFGLLVGVSFVNEVAGVSVNSLTYRLRALNLSPNPDWDAIFAPSLSPLIGHWQAFKAANLEFAWLRAAGDTVQVDGMVLALCVAFVLFCVYMLVQVIRLYRTNARVLPIEPLATQKPRVKGRTPQTRTPAPIYDLPRIVGRTAIVIVVMLSGLLMLRYAGDPRFGGNAGYKELLTRFQAQANPEDVLILNDDAQARYFFNTDRAPNKWYGLSRDPARWDAPTQALVTRIVHVTPRLWFAYDDTVDAPNPMRDWFAANLKADTVASLGNGVHLIQYQGGTP